MAPGKNQPSGGGTTLVGQATGRPKNDRSAHPGPRRRLLCRSTGQFAEPRHHVPNLAYSSPENRSHADCRVIPRAVPMRAQVTFRSRKTVTSRWRLASV
jgi:hypothetical protein